MSYIVEEDEIKEYSLPDGGKKVIKYHKKGENILEYISAADCMTIEIYDSKGELVSKETKKNPDRDHTLF
jgi:hypothetical protein